MTSLPPPPGQTQTMIDPIIPLPPPCSNPVPPFFDPVRGPLQASPRAQPLLIATLEFLSE